jgi:transposase
MESSTVHRVYRFHLEPTADQEQRLQQFAGARRFIWNWALEQRRAHHRQTGKTLPAKELSARLTAQKAQPETAWLRGMDSQLLQQVLGDLQRAFVHFFKRRARYPRFKSRKRDQARFRIPQRVHVVGGRVQVPKVGRVRLRLSRPVEGQTKSATFKGTHVVVIDRFYPSTQLCHVCGYKNEALTLADRTWQCPACATVHDRDLNAALNIRDEGLRLLAVGHMAIAQRSRLWRGGKTTDGGTPQRSRNPTPLAVRSVKVEWAVEGMMAGTVKRSSRGGTTHLPGDREP